MNPFGKIPGRYAPWICAVVFVIMSGDQLAMLHKQFSLAGVLILLGFAAFGFVLGLGFWWRDRWRGP